MNLSGPLSPYPPPDGAVLNEPKPAPGPAKAPGRPRRKVKIRAWDVLLLIYALMALVVFINILAHPPGNPPPLTVETATSLRAERTGNGDWSLSVVSGSRDLADIRMVVIDVASNISIINTALSAMDATEGHYNDSNRNRKLDAGDSILIRSTAGVDPGMEVQIWDADSIVGTVKELPE